MSPAESGVSAAARRGPHAIDDPVRFVAIGADAVEIESGRRDRGNTFEGTPQGEERAEQAQERRQDGDASQCSHVAPEPLALDAVRQRDRSLQIGGRAAPAADRRQRDSRRRARVSLTMIERLAAIEPSLVQPIEKSGRELGGNNPVPPEPSQPLEQHAQPETRHRRPSPPR